MLKKISDRYYSRLIPAGNEELFEFNRSSEFFSALLGDDFVEPELTIDLTKLSIDIPALPDKYAVLFIGCSSESKRWPVSKFAEISLFLKREYSLDTVLCGGPGEQRLVEDYQSCFRVEFVNLVGALSLVECAAVLQRARFLVSNETFAPHMAVALGVPRVLVLSNGEGLRRFVPYPSGFAKGHSVLFPSDGLALEEETDIPASGCSADRIMDINDITVEQVCCKICDVLKVL